MGVIKIGEIEPINFFPGVTHYFGVTSSIGSENCQMAIVKLDAGVRLAPHTHPVDDAMYVLSGQGLFTLGNEEIPIGPDMFLVAPPNTRHGLENIGKEPLAIIFAWPTSEEVPRIPAP